MRQVLVYIFAAIFLASAARGGDDPRRAQVAVAKANAIGAIRQQVLLASVGRDLTVGDFVRRNGMQGELDSVFEHARQIGGVRWIDDQICQVQMELSGREVAQALKRIVDSKQVQLTLSDWERRTFTATGASLSAANVETLRPAQNNEAWVNVADEARRRALIDARQNAIAWTLDSVCPIPMAEGKTVADALRDPGVNQAMVGWLAARPVVRADFRDDRQVELTLAASAEETFGVFRDAVGAAKGVAAPNDWGILRDRWFKAMAAPVGKGIAAAGNETSQAAVRIPRRPPEWADRQMDTEGVAACPGFPLKAARAAERVALNRLRGQVCALSISPGVKLGDAAKGNPRIAAALDQAMSRARTYRADYAADGSVTVRVSIDLRELWGELQMLP